MIKPSAVLLVRGDNFSPGKAESLLHIDFGPEKNEPGDIGVRGKHKDQPCPYGSATIHYTDVDCLADLKNNNPDLLPHNLSLFVIPDFIKTLRDCEGTNITLYVNVGYESQCNLELSPQLWFVGQLIIPVGITCCEL